MRTILGVLILGLAGGVGLYVLAQQFGPTREIQASVISSPALARVEPSPPVRPAEPERIVLRAPDLERRPLENLWPRIDDAERLIELSKRYPLLATATDYNSPVFAFKNERPYVVGYVRYGQIVRASEAVEAYGCTGGSWHEIEGGHLCSEEGFAVRALPVELEAEYTRPKIVAIEPFLYAKPNKGAPRLSRIPSAAEEKLLAAGDRDKLGESDLVAEWLDGAYFVAIDEESIQDGHSYYRTGMGNYLRKEDVKLLEQSEMHGEFLDEQRRLPLAFVYGQQRSLFCLDEADALKDCGVADKHARIFVSRRLERDGVTYLVDEQGRALRRQDTRLVEFIERPEGIPEGARWMHIDLAEQCLVAYEQDKPVLATLVSSGVDSHATPTGTYKIQRRYLTKTMSGPDPDHGVYEVAEVPWTMYYHGNYAIHGAYWHEVFGEQRSHGCTNLPCADARWLFRWIEPELPRGWYVMFYRDQTWVHFTD